MVQIEMNIRDLLNQWNEDREVHQLASNRKMQAKPEQEEIRCRSAMETSTKAWTHNAIGKTANANLRKELAYVRRLRDSLQGPTLVQSKPFGEDDACILNPKQTAATGRLPTISSGKSNSPGLPHSSGNQETTRMLTSALTRKLPVRPPTFHSTPPETIGISGRTKNAPSFDGSPNASGCNARSRDNTGT
jgi:hypothetical protein